MKWFKMCDSPERKQDNGTEIEMKWRRNGILHNGMLKDYRKFYDSRRFDFNVWPQLRHQNKPGSTSSCLYSSSLFNLRITLKFI